MHWHLRWWDNVMKLIATCIRSGLSPNQMVSPPKKEDLAAVLEAPIRGRTHSRSSDHLHRQWVTLSNNSPTIERLCSGDADKSAFRGTMRIELTRLHSCASLFLGSKHVRTCSQPLVRHVKKHHWFDRQRMFKKRASHPKRLDIAGYWAGRRKETVDWRMLGQDSFAVIWCYLL